MVSKSKSINREKTGIILAILSLVLYLVVDYFRPQLVSVAFCLPISLTLNTAFYLFAFPLKIIIGAVSLKLAGENKNHIVYYILSYIIAIILYIISVRLFYIKSITECLYLIISIPILEFHFLIALTLRKRLEKI